MEMRFCVAVVAIPMVNFLGWTEVSDFLKTNFFEKNLNFFFNFVYVYVDKKFCPYGRNILFMQRENFLKCARVKNIFCSPAM